MQVLFKSTIAPARPTWRSEAPALEGISAESRPRLARLVLLLVLALGVGVRLYHFFYNRSFFIDELYLNVNTIKMGFWELATGPFDYQQKAPVGYLWAARLCVMLFGKKEMALRLFPLLCGLGTLAAFTVVARHFLKAWGAVVAVGILALSAPVIYHSVEAKQYSTELLVAALALLWYVRFHRQARWPALLAWGVLGAVALWFSFSVIFVLAGMAIVVSSRLLLARRWRKLFRYLVPFTLWLVTFAVQYHFFIGKYPQSGWLIDFFDKVYHGFMPLPPASVADLVWYVRQPYILLLDPLGLLIHLDGNWGYLQESSWRYLFKMGWLPAGLLVGGMGVAYVRQRTLFFCLLLTLVLVLLASGLRMYPFTGRFVLFLTPVLALFIGFGIDRLCELFQHRPAWFYTPVALLLLMLGINTGRQLAYTDLVMCREYNRDPLLYVNAHYQPGDVVYVFWNMSHAYEYYKDAYQLKFDAVQGRNPKSYSRNAAEFLRNLEPDFRQFKGKKRLWFVHDYENRNAIGEYVFQPPWYHHTSFVPSNEVQARFGRMGRKVTEFRHKSYKRYPHAVALFELNP